MILSALAIGAVGGSLVHPLTPPGHPDSPKPRGEVSPDSAGVIAALARLQPRGGVIPVYGPPGDRIGKLCDGIVVGAELKAGQPIAELASKAERETEVGVAEIQTEEAAGQLKKAEAAGLAKVAAARLEAEQAIADEEDDRKALNLRIGLLEKQQKYADLQVEQIEKLAAEGTRISADEREQARLLAAKAAGEVEAARIKLKKVGNGYARGRDLARAKVAAAEAELAEATARVPIRSAAKKLAGAKQLLALTTLKAPVSGTVLKIASYAGEPTGAHQPVLYMADVSTMVAAAEVYESDVPQLWDGLAKGHTFAATISSPALPPGTTLRGALHGGTQISRMISRNAIFALSPREDTDRRVIDTRVELDPESSRLAANYIGLQVNIELSPAGGP